MKKKGLFLLVVFLLSSFASQAQVEDNPQEISVFASSCEPMINGESRSSARIRAVDKTSFKAVETIPELSTYKDSLTTHDFNLGVYRLIDNYLEDMKITSSNDETAVCVEISAYLPASAVAEVFSELSSQEEALTVEEKNLSSEVNITIPPKPEIVINQEIAYETSTPQAEEKPVNKQNLASEDVFTKVFVDKTEFYDGTSTNGFFSHLEQDLIANPGIKVIARPDNPDYILNTKVLKARVDNINSQTSRMQIVAALELTNTATSETITEHQNRFVLFNAEDDAQKVASDLTKKLFSAGLEKLLPKIKVKRPNGEMQSVITPH